MYGRYEWTLRVDVTSGRYERPVDVIMDTILLAMLITDNAYWDNDIVIKGASLYKIQLFFLH